MDGDNSQRFEISLLEDKKNLDLEKIDNALFQKYHFSLEICSKHPFLLDSIIRRLFSQNRVMLERIILENPLEMVHSKGLKEKWFTIHDGSLVSSIFNIYEDKKKAIILRVLSKKRPKIIAEIVDLCGLQEDTAYKKINELIRDGMLIEQGGIYTTDARELKKYVPIFRSVEIGVLNKKMTVRIKLTNGALKASYINSFLQSLKTQLDKPSLFSYQQNF